MKLYNVRGHLVGKNVTKYLIKWDKPSKSKLQFQVKQFFKPFWSACICYEEFPVYGTQLKVDILNATLRIAVEVNGPQHSEFHYFHGGEPMRYLDSFMRDENKTVWLEKNNFKFLVINFDEVPLLTPEFIQEKFNVSLL